MNKRDVRQWAKKQYAGDVTPFPLWLRVTIAAGLAVIILLKLVGVI